MACGLHGKPGLIALSLVELGNPREPELVITQQRQGMAQTVLEMQMEQWPVIQIPVQVCDHYQYYQ